MIERFIDEKKLAGAVLLVWKKGAIIYKEALGMKEDSIFRISSMTKPVTSVIAMKLIAEGKMKLDDPIANWFPAFASMKVLKNAEGNLKDTVPANRAITIYDLLTHTAGFTYSEFHTGPIRTAYRDHLGGDIDTHLKVDEWISNLALLPLIDQPGENFHYGKSTDLLGFIIARIEGKSLGEVMHEKIFEPLGMHDTFFDVPPEKKDRCVPPYGFDDNGNLIILDQVPFGMALNERPADMEFESGGQGLWSTASDYLQFARIFVEEGKILNTDALQMMCTNQLNPAQRKNGHLLGASVFDGGHGYGLGVAVVTDAYCSLSIPCGGKMGAVGWPGGYGGWWRADKQEETIMIFLTHSMAHPAQLAMGIGFGVYEAIDKFQEEASKLFP